MSFGRPSIPLLGEEYALESEGEDVFDTLSLLLQHLKDQLKHLFELMDKLLQLLKSMTLKIANNTSQNFKEVKEIKSQETHQESIIEQPRVGGFHEIAGHSAIKSTLYTLVILPKQQPQLFENRTVSNSILLYGPPGTGKTRLVHALAAECNAPLYSVSVSDLLGSYVGETEKCIKDIFTSIKKGRGFSIFFIDELDGLCRKRCDSENEYSRRIKTELMCQLTKIENCLNFVVIAATNCPWDLDSAILRRFQKRIYVPLPNSVERHELFQILTQNIYIVNSKKETESLIEMCDGYSGSDISCIVQDALDMPLIELQNNTIWIKSSDQFLEPFTTNKVCNNAEDIIVSELKHLPPASVRARPVNVLDFFEAAKQVNPTVKLEDIKRYEQFNSR